ncbi:hypothetical protein [Longispora fulva]|uniref:Uncharacterized protein n=1 Tax=Longispora fulva TaxID=619741 RepID=A0A8J7KMG5_9ACTN|nr:hypothetical protein [Longispora fulva]MBG6133992.1 hypothetical protein [Longispora fulva]
MRLIDRILGLAATKAVASASCQMEYWTEYGITRCNYATHIMERAVRTCQTMGNCTVQCSAWGWTCATPGASC